jgi:hypothetical protein
MELVPLGRVLYIDIDVHHGDGVEDAFKGTGQVSSSSGGGSANAARGGPACNPSRELRPTQAPSPHYTCHCMS